MYTELFLGESEVFRIKDQRQAGAAEAARAAQNRIDHPTSGQGDWRSCVKTVQDVSL